MNRYAISTGKQNCEKEPNRNTRVKSVILVMGLTAD